MQLINIEFATVSKQGLSSSLLTDIIHNQAVLIIDNFPNSGINNDALLNQFINNIGRPIVDFRSHSTIFDVKVSKRNNLFESFANSNHYFSLHTDCSDFEVIPNGLAMLCVTPAQQGGESIFVTLDNVITHLEPNDLQLLLTKKWVFRNQQRCILTKDCSIDMFNDTSHDRSHDKYKICYNRIMLESYTQLTEEEWAFLDRFDNLLAEHAFEYTLKENQLVICNNHTMLHGRLEFPENDSRLIKRIRFDFNSL